MLIVEGDDLPGGGREDTLHPGQEGGLELLGLNQQEDPPDCVVRRYPVGEVKEGREPVVLGPAALFKDGTAVGAANGATDREYENVMEAMELEVLAPRVFEVVEVGGDCDRRRCGRG